VEGEEGNVGGQGRKYFQILKRVDESIDGERVEGSQFLLIICQVGTVEKRIKNQI